MERSTIINGKIHYKWPFSIAMLVYQRIVPSLPGTEALDDKMKYLADFGSLHPVPEGTEGTEGGAG